MPLYNSFKADLLGGAVGVSADAAGGTLRVLLLSASYTPDVDTHTRYSDLSAHEVNLHGATGYAAGGLALSGSLAITFDTTNDRGYFDAADVTWGSSTITARYLAIVKVRAAGVNKNLDNLVGYIDFGSNQSSSNGNFTLQWNASGILLLT
jgi:hypothetical protein